MFHVEQQAPRILLRRSNNIRCETIRAPGTSPCSGFSVISLARYTALLAQPTLRSAFAASVLGRLPIGIAGLSILMMARDATGSFASAGVVAAWYVAGLAATAPVLGRVIDRYGPRSTLFCCALAFPSSLAALVVALSMPAPLWLAFVLAAGAGAAFPPITVCMRTFFKLRLKDDSLATAYSLESVLIELIFILGPVLVAMFVAFASPAAAVLFAAACGCAGTLLFRDSEALRRWTIVERADSSLFGPLAEPGFVPLLAVILCYATSFGLVEIGTIAFATELNNDALAGVLLGIMSIGSAAGGIVYGSRSWRLPLARQFPLMLALMGLCVGPLALWSSSWAFGIWCLVAGIAMAPALIMQSMLVARNARPEYSTEAFTWSTTGLLAGVGVGLTAGGLLLEHARSPAVFAAATALAIAAGAMSLLLVKIRN